MRAYIRLMDAVSRLCGIVAMALLAAAVFVVCYMIFVRYVLGHSTIWQTEFTIYALMAATFIGSPYVLMLRGHVGVDLLPLALPERGRIVLEVVAGLLGLAFCMLLAYASWIYFHEAWAGGWRTDTVWAPPLWIPVAPLPLGAGLLCLQYVAELMKLNGARQ
ncbi:TRAP transporter small permease subunit [Kaustia mangrovi]|nr:TRAP transporter small permease [Kaustia mangrovi]